MTKATKEVRYVMATLKARFPLKLRYGYPRSGFYVRVETSTGHIRGFLSDRGGVGGVGIAEWFGSAIAAGHAAADKGFRFYTICEISPA